MALGRGADGSTDPTRPWPIAAASDVDVDARGYGAEPSGEATQPARRRTLRGAAEERWHRDEVTTLDLYDVFFRAEYPRLVTLLVAVAVTGSRPVAEELAQEALLRAHVRWDRLVRYDKPGAWARRVALNLASHHVNRRRSERRTVERLTRQREPYAYVDAGPSDDFWALVRRLPRQQAAAVALHHLEDRSVAEVATILGCAEGTAKAHLHRGRAALARMLDLPEEDT